MNLVHHDFRLPAFEPQRALEKALLQPACSDDRLSWESLAATATIVLATTGGSIRTIVTGRRVITTGVYASRKSGRAQPYESMIERAFFMHCEVDTDVVDYAAQPFRFEFVIGGTKRAYIVDAITLRSDGTVEIVEIKNDRRALRDPDYRLKLSAVREICEAVGWRFRIVFRSDLFEPVEAHRAVEDVQSWAFTEYRTADVFEVVRQLRAHGPLPLGKLAECLAERPLGIAKLKAMMVARIVRLDLTSIPSHSTTVTLVEAPREEIE